MRFVDAEVVATVPVPSSYRLAGPGAWSPDSSRLALVAHGSADPWLRTLDLTGAVAVAEGAIAMAMHLVKRFGRLTDLVRSGRWADRGSVAISGVGKVRVWARDDLDIAVAGVGRVDYWGTPTVVRRHVAGTAQITDRGAKTGAP